MTYPATAVAVNVKNLGANLVGDHASGVTTLNLTSVYNFPTSGTLLIGDDGYAYSAAPNEQANTITLTAPTAAAYEDGQRVEVFPTSPTYYATVMIGSDQPGVNALIPHFLVPLLSEQMAPGGIPVMVEPTNSAGFEWLVTEVPGRQPAMDLQQAPLVVAPPDSSQTPVLEKFSVGALRWSIPFASSQFAEFYVFADTVDPPTPDLPHLVYQGSSLSGTFSAIDGVALLPDDPTAAIPTYYVAAMEYNPGGGAALSATSNGESPRRASVPEISADWAYLGQVDANQLRAGSILTALLGIGSYIELDGANSYITIYQDAAHTIPLVQLRPDGSVFRGRVIADDVSVLNGLILQGTASHVAVSGGVTLDSGVIDPNAAPTLTLKTDDQQAWPAVSGNQVSKGICWDGSQWLRLTRNPNTGTVRVERIDSSGAVTSTTTLSGPNFTIDDDVNSIVKIGSFWYIGNYVNDTGRWTVRKFNTSGVDQGGCLLSTTTFPGRMCAVGTDGTDLLVVYPSGASALTVDKVAVATFTVSATWTGGTFTGSCCYVGRGSFDFGADRIVVATNGSINNVTAYTLSGTTLTEDTAKKFSTNGSVGSGGVTWDGTRFVSFAAGTDTVLKRYSSYYPAASEKAWVTYADTDGTAITGKHTKDSPQASITMVPRRYVQVSLPPAPTGAATPRVYVGFATSSPADAALLRRSETITSRNALINPATAAQTATVTNKALTSNVATLTTSAAHGLHVGDNITVAGVDATFNGNFKVTAVGSTTTLSYAKTASNVASTASGGTITNTATDDNTFGGGTAAWVKSQTGGLELYGDGVFKLSSVDLTTGWASYTPALTGASADPNIGSTGTITGKWKKIGKTIHWKVAIDCSGSGIAAGTGDYRVSLPSNASADSKILAHVTTASAAGADPTQIGVAIFDNASRVKMRVGDETSVGTIGSTVRAVAAGRYYYLSGTYEEA